VTFKNQHLFDAATTQERSGLWPEAARNLSLAYQLAVQNQDTAGILEAVVRLAYCHAHAGDRTVADEEFSLSVELARIHGADSVAGRALNGRGNLARERGDLSEAEHLFRSAREFGERCGDWVLLGETEQNLGIVANIRGDLEEARSRYQAGLEHVDRGDSDRGRITVLNNLGMLHVELGELDAAEAYFDRALALCSKINDVVRAGVIHTNRAELFLAKGDVIRARESCDEGFEIFSQLGDLLRQAEALKFYGIIYRHSGKPHLASIHLQRAIDIAATADPLLEAQAQRELALVLREQGRNRDALAALNRSHTLFTGLQAQTKTADIQERIDRLEADFLVLVQQWGESIEAKDRYTVGHCLRVADYACRLAEKVGIAPHEMVWFRMGAFLHDLGKIEVPEEVLNKPGRLTDEERAVMERHPVTGEAMLGSVDFPWDIRPMVRSHHERWDGGGYPDRLVGEAIPFSARILRVADVFDALTTARSYRRPLTPAEAMAIMVEDQGSFDAQIFAAFQELFPELSVTAEQASSIYPA
jgi:putative nucleotidyltransferase with HDIG domain